MGTAVETLKRRTRELLRTVTATAAPALPHFSIRLCWPLPVSTASSSRQVAPLVAIVQLTVGRQPLPGAAQVAVTPRRPLRRGGEAVRQLEAVLRTARREANREFARPLIEHRQERKGGSVVAGAGAGPDTRLRFTPPRHRLHAMVLPKRGVEGFQSWILLCISRADDMALRWQRRPRQLAFLAAPLPPHHRHEL